MSKTFQSTVIVLLVLILLRLYPEFGEFTGFAGWVVLALSALALIIVGLLWLAGFVGNWISNRPARSKERAELKEISKTLKQMDRMKK